MWYLQSYQVTEQWTSCAGQETPDILVWRAQISVLLLTSSNPALSSATAKMPETHSASPPKILAFTAVIKQSNFSMCFLNFNLFVCISTSVSSSIFLLRWISEGTPLKTEVRLLFSLSFSWQVISSTAHKHSWFTGMLLKYVEEI